ncbi:hypothetical protein QQF64_014681 [Cirrhinus molitorella]|uniref:Uncharacterized protein n=1 Tax=Cirrhinus molitorella TaxID=172907 RepID=A0ABR3NTH1_9TELE
MSFCSVLEVPVSSHGALFLIGPLVLVELSSSSVLLWSCIRLTLRWLLRRPSVHSQSRCTSSMTVLHCSSQ